MQSAELLLSFSSFRWARFPSPVKSARILLLHKMGQRLLGELQTNLVFTRMLSDIWTCYGLKTLLLFRKVQSFLFRTILLSVKCMEPLMPELSLLEKLDLICQEVKFHFSNLKQALNTVDYGVPWVIFVYICFDWFAFIFWIERSILR